MEGSFPTRPAGKEKRKQVSVRVAPVSLRLSRRVRAMAGDNTKGRANSEERFNQVVLGEVTFKEQTRLIAEGSFSESQTSSKTVSIKEP